MAVPGAPVGQTGLLEAWLLPAAALVVLTGTDIVWVARRTDSADATAPPSPARHMRVGCTTPAESCRADTLSRDSGGSPGPSGELQELCTRPTSGWWPVSQPPDGRESPPAWKHGRVPESVAPEVLTTARLRLQPLAAADVAEVHAIYADLGTWLHLPSGRHTAIAQAERMVDESEQSWAATGLGRWAIRLRKDLPGTDLAAGTLIGVASATLLNCGARNLGYRLTPASWGVGLATEAAAVALAAAQASTYPVTARALAGNPASVRVLERIGLTLVWRGQGPAGTDALGDSPGSTAPRDVERDSAPAPAPAPAPTPAPAPAPGQPDTTVLERFIFADRPLAPELLAAIIRLG